MKILALSGSLRKASFNTRLARALAVRAPDGMTVELATCHGIPLYDGDDEERDGVPDSVLALRDRIKAADALVLITPEYNAGMPGVLKNALDWLTRPPSEIGATFQDRPTALAGATPGGLGTILAQGGSLVVLRQLKVRLFPDHLRISHAGDLLGEAGEIDDATTGMLDRWLAGFAEFVKRC